MEAKDMIVNNQWINKIIKEKIKKNLKTNENDLKIYRTQKM